MTPKIALIIGGASSVHVHVSASEKLIGNNLNTRFVINDIATIFERVDHWVTLHPEKLALWRHARREAGFDMPERVWAHTPRNGVTDVFTDDWRGSSGLFAVAIALSLGFNRIILCGVELTPEKHIIRNEDWKHYSLFRQGWLNHSGDMFPYVRSWGGWTADLLGRPSKLWLKCE